MPIEVKSELLKKISPSLTADDWGMAPSINWGILDLAERGLVKRVSIMSNTRFVQTGLKNLLKVDGLSLGLHFNITYGRPVGDPALEQTLLRLDSSGRYQFYPAKKTFIRWVLRQIATTDLRRALVTQLTRLQRDGVEISYLDSHHHVHLLPGFISSIADLLHRAGIKQIRVPYDPRLWKTKKAALNALSLLLKIELRKNGFQWIPCCYPQISDYEDAELFQQLLHGKDGYDIITHPSIDEDFSELEFPDIYTIKRYKEYQVLRKLK